MADKVYSFDVGVGGGGDGGPCLITPLLGQGSVHHLVHDIRIILAFYCSEEIPHEVVEALPMADKVYSFDVGVGGGGDGGVVDGIRFYVEVFG
eukprot:CAMPEP_0198278112 /NCGR_PEP_ID=MMETSP1447-20131203/66210_1 /TAXON_ID=420782 /ORGANISM="Chaetoceros dichaeta, Strain CCMP1751" /LENGTH=92 /DNA_ID=CAMNT_0043973181 /DNA_START=702 /DNA_END=980 /DNA_ORIENTATION=+